MKQKKIKIEPRIKLNYTIYMYDDLSEQVNKDWRGITLF